MSASEQTVEFALTMQIGLRRILLVESEPDQSIYWTELLGSLGFHVVPAASITEAKLLLADQPAIIVCSALLSDGRGSEFIAQLRRREDLARVYLILLTNSFGHDELIESLTGGANDCMDKSASYSEVRARLKLAERVLTLNEALLDKSARLTDAIRMIRNELESAARLQAAMLPRPLHEGALQVQTFYQPSDLLGGDMLGLTRLDAGQRIAFGLIDVAGHGTASALISCSLMREMMDRMLVLLEGGVGAERCGQQVIEEMNRRYFQLDMPGMYFTAVAGVLDTRSWELSYCQAGHPSLLLYDPKSNWQVLEDSGFPVGLFEDAQYGTREVQLTAGQKLLAISDGLLRPRPDDPAGGLAVLELLRRSPPQGPVVMQRLEELAASASFDERDDQSAMLICFGDTLNPG
ncbi:MAG TPA: fused response regulator/phosphatase [Steroidobacteraceae bacterium]|nr:fused response regulator/phosphatase [Steroidobacteraceae bacterium]